MARDNSSQKSSNTVWQDVTIQREDRQKITGHRSAVLWMTGLSGAGKSTVASAVEARLHQMGCLTYVCDGDNVRHGLNGDLSFSAEDRVENIRRIGEVVKLFIDSGVIVLTAFISPYKEDRQRVRKLLEEGDFIEVYCRCKLEVCEDRDVKGLYKKARAGEISDFTGISSPYEAPENAEVVIDTDQQSIDECVDQVIAYLKVQGVIGSD